MPVPDMGGRRPPAFALPVGIGATGEVLRRSGLTVLIATSGFRQGPGPRAAAAAIAEGVHEASPRTRVLPVPTMEGSGFAEEVTRLWSGVVDAVTVVDEHGRPTMARIGLAGPASERVAIIGVDEPGNARRPPHGRRDPSCASSRGIGQLVRAALDRGARRIVIGCGDGGANDGGIGMATELGIRFLDSNRMEIVEAGGLQRLSGIDLSRRDPRLDGVLIEVVVDPGTDLLGRRGTARLFAARGGASDTQARRLELGLARYAEVVRGLSGIDVARLPGGGAGGGLAAGFASFLGARLTPRVDFLRHTLRMESRLADADMAIAASDQPAPGDPIREVPAWVVSRARALGMPVVTLAAPPRPEGADIEPVDPPVPDPGGNQRPDDAWPRTRDWLRHAGSRVIRAAIGRVTPSLPPPGTAAGTY